MEFASQIPPIDFIANNPYTTPMPELPEVQTTVDGINTHLKGLTINDVWTDYRSDFHKNKDNIKDPKFFNVFRKSIIGSKIVFAERKAKNILIYLSNNQIILIHMKMTGHLLYGTYKKITNKDKEQWLATEEGPLRDDPFNQHIRLVFSFSNKKHLAFSDMRKFAKVTLLHKDTLRTSLHLKLDVPEPLDESCTYRVFTERILMRPQGKIKQVLMDPSIIAGIGNIYSDEILWKSGIHPLSKPSLIPEPLLKKMYENTKEVLRKGIRLGGDSTSDYRTLTGIAGEFHGTHNAYQRHTERCTYPKCKGTLERIKINTRSAHFCNTHQTLFL